MKIFDYKIERNAISITAEHDKWIWKIFRPRKTTVTDTFVARIREGCISGIFDGNGNSLDMDFGLGYKLKNLVKLAHAGVDIRTK